MRNKRDMFFRKHEPLLLITARQYLSIKDNLIAANENIEVAKKLITQGSNVNLIVPPNKRTLEYLDREKTSYFDAIGETVLMSYAFAGCTDMVKFILEHQGEKTINVRNFTLTQLDAYCMQDTENIIAKKMQQTSDSYRFESALSLAFISSQTTDGEILRLLLAKGADLSLFYDNEFYRPVMFAAIGNFDDHHGVVKPEYRHKVQIILNKMLEEGFHNNVCAETYKIFTDMLSEHGCSYKLDSRSVCVIS